MRLPARSTFTVTLAEQASDDHAHLVFAVQVASVTSAAQLVPSPATPFFEGGRVSQTLHRASKTLFDST